MKHTNVIILRVFTLFILIVNVSGISGQHLCIGDSTFVAPSSGLLIRANPTINSKVKGKFLFNDLVIYNPTNQLDTIDNRTGFWVEVDNGTKGYVFGGYLNQYKLPIKKYGLFNEYIVDFAKEFSIIITRQFNSKQNGSITEITSRRLIFKEFLTIVNYDNYEYAKDEYFFEGIRMSEFLNVFELMKYYYGDLENEIKYEFVGQGLDWIRYGVPDAGMEFNEIRMLENGILKVTFEYSL